MSLKFLLPKRRADLTFMVSLDGAGAPKMQYRSYRRAQREARRLSRRFEQPARVMMLTDVYFPRADGENVIHGAVLSGDWSVERVGLQPEQAQEPVLRQLTPLLGAALRMIR